eukprot:gene17229-biopygen8918
MMTTGIPENPGKARGSPEGSGGIQKKSGMGQELDSQRRVQVLARDPARVHFTFHGPLSAVTNVAVLPASPASAMAPAMRPTVASTT